MPPITSSVNPIVSDCFRDYYGSGNPACVLRGVVPILWFGDMDAYRESEKKIVTVAVNPSYKEFQDDKGKSSIGYRFPGAPANYDPHNPQHFEAYKNAMDSYFKNKPYTKWFWHNEKVLRLFDASYQGTFCTYKNDSEEAFTNTALHIDLKAPVATYPVWGDKELAPRERKAVVKLYAKYFDRMWHYLDPDMMIVSTNAQDVKASFEINHENAVIPRTSKRGYVDLHVIVSPVSGKRVNIVWGLNHGTPFSGAGMTYEFIRESCCAIRQEIQF